MTSTMDFLLERSEFAKEYAVLRPLLSGDVAEHGILMLLMTQVAARNGTREEAAEVAIDWCKLASKSDGTEFENLTVTQAVRKAFPE